LTQHYGQRGQSSGSGSALEKGVFPFSLDNLECRGPHLVDIFCIFLPPVVGIKTWKLQTSGGSSTYRRIVNVMDEAFLLLLLMNNAEMWLWEWNCNDGRLTEEEESNPPKRRFTVKSNKTKAEKDKEAAAGDKSKGYKNTGWSDEGKLRLKEMAISFHNIRKDVPELEDPLDKAMNEYLEETRANSGKRTLSAAVQSAEGREKLDEEVPEEDLNGFGLFDLQGFDSGMEAV